MTLEVIAVGVVGAIAMLVGQLIFSRVGDALKRKSEDEAETREQVIRIQERMSQPGQSPPSVETVLLGRLDGLAAQVQQLSTTLARIEGTVQSELRHHGTRLDNLERRDSITLRELTSTLDAALAPITARVTALERQS